MGSMRLRRILFIINPYSTSYRCLRATGTTRYLIIQDIRTSPSPSPCMHRQRRIKPLRPSIR